MSDLREKGGSAPQLDPGLQRIVQEDIAQGFSVGFGGDLTEYIAGNPEVFQTGIAAQMAGVIDYLTQDRASKPPVPAETDYHTRTRTLTVLDQFVEHPEDLEGFLTDPRVTESTLITNDHFLTVAPIRFWNSGGDIESTERLLSFALGYAEEQSVIAENFAAGLSSTLHQRGYDPARLSRLLEYIPKGLIAGEQLESINSRIRELGEIATRAQEAEHVKAEQQAQAELAKIEHERAIEERQASLGQIKQQPNQAFADVLGSSGDVDLSNARELSESILLRAASTYLLATRFSESDPDLEQQATDILRVTFDSLIKNSDVHRSVTDQLDFKPLIPHLALLVPDFEALDDLVLQVPSLWGDKDFYNTWKGVFIDDRLRERAAESIDQSVVENLIAQDVRELKLENRSLGVPYADIDELAEDLRKFFIHGIGDLPQSKLAHTSEILDDSSGFATSVISQFSRSDEEILGKDIIEPLQEFIMDLAGKKAKGTTLFTFETSEARHGGTPYKYETTSFAGHAISIKVAVGGDGAYTYFLDMRGGGYDVESYRGERLARYAAFVDKDVAFFEGDNVQISVEREEDLRLRRLGMRDEELADMEASLLAAGPVPDPVSSYHEGKKWEDRIIWDLPYDKKPHSTAAAAIQEVLGEETPLEFSIGYLFQGDPRAEVGKEAVIPEPQKTFEIRTQFDTPGSRQAMAPDRRILLSEAARFYASNISAEQSEKLTHLAHLISDRSREYWV